MKINVTECPYCDKEFIEPDNNLYESCPRCGHLLDDPNSRAHVNRSFEVHE